MAGAFVLHVVEPHLNGPAGEVPILLAPAGGEVRVLCGQGVAPAGATVAHYRSLGLDMVPGTGPLAAAVPGAFDAWMLLLRDHGTKPLADVLKYAIGYAEDGHPPVERVGETVETVRELFETEWTTSAEVYLPGGRSPRPGELLRNPALAATWKRLLAEVAGAGDREAQIEAARDVWRTGFVAEALLRQSARPTLDTSGEHHTGTLTADDLAAWSAGYEDPVTYDFGGWTVCKAGPWSQGPVLLQQLALLPPELPPYGSAAYLHLLIENCKLAMADREAWYGDAAEVPLDDLLSAEYNAERRTRVGPRASRALRPGSPGGRTPGWPASPASRPPDARPRARRAPESPPSPRAPPPGARRTRGLRRRLHPRRHLSPRHRRPLGQHDLGHAQRRLAPVQPRRARTGLPARHPAADDVAGGGAAQQPRPGPPPPHHAHAVPRAARRGARHGVRHPGGDQQDQWQLHFFLAVALRAKVRGGLDLQGAIDAPNWHNDSFPGSFHPRGMRPGSVTVESRTDPEVVEELRRRGHDVTVGDAWSEGRLCAVARDPHTGVLSAAANPRGGQGVRGGPLSPWTTGRAAHFRPARTRDRPRAGRGLSVTRALMEE